MNIKLNKTGLALASLLVVCIFSAAPASARDLHSGIKIYFPTSGYQDGHHKRHYGHRQCRHQKRHHYRKHQWKRWKRHFRLHRNNTHQDRHHGDRKYRGHKGHNKSKYGIRFYYYDS